MAAWIHCFLDMIVGLVWRISAYLPVSVCSMIWINREKICAKIHAAQVVLWGNGEISHHDVYTPRISYPGCTGLWHNSQSTIPQRHPTQPPPVPIFLLFFFRPCLALPYLYLIIPFLLLSARSAPSLSSSFSLFCIIILCEEYQALVFACPLRRHGD